MKALPLAVLLIPFALFIFAYLFFVFANIYHLRKYGINAKATQLIITVYLVGTVALFIVSGFVIVTHDWSQPLEISSFVELQQQNVFPTPL